MSTKRKQRGRAETRQPLRLASLDPPAPQPPNRATPTVLLDSIIILSRSHREVYLQVSLCFMLSLQNSVPTPFRGTCVCVCVRTRVDVVYVYVEKGSLQC